MAGTAAAGVSGDIRSAESYTSDQFSQVEVTSTQLSGGKWIGPMVRAQSGGQSAYVGIYFWNNGSPVLMLFKRAGGGWTQLGATYNSGALAAGTQLKLTVTGSAISFQQNGVTRITATDTSLSGGGPGIMSYGTGRVNNWSGGTATGGGGGGTTHTVGGTVSGLSGTAVLQDNAGDDLSVTANGSFTFATALATGAAYTVTVKTSPAGQSCTVANGTGTIGSANITNVAITCTSSATHTVGGTVSGLSGTAVLQDNAGDDLSVTANGSFTFATALATGAAYTVTVKTSPAGQSCTVANGTGTIGSANITNVAITCTSSATHTVGGTVSGLSGTAVLQDNAGDDLSVTANGSFTFATALATGAAYTVTVKTSPAGQSCTVANGTGTIGSANITNVAITCTSSATHTVGGTVSGLSGTAVLQDNAGDDLSVTANGSFTFATALATGAAYTVTVKTSPAGQSCTVANGTGTIGSANITNVAITCTSSATHTVGGTVSGLSGTAVLQDNAGDDLSVTANGSFTFATALATGAAYSRHGQDQPRGPVLHGRQRHRHHRLGQHHQRRHHLRG